LFDILDNKGKKNVDEKIVKFKSTVESLKPTDIAKNTSVKFFSKKGDSYDPKSRSSFNFINKTTGQCKSALAYNDMLKFYNLLKDKEPIYNGSKIKWVYLKNNSFGLDGMAMKDDGTDPKQVLDFIDQYIDREKIFEKELETKLFKFYDALGWEIYSEHAEKAGEFFDFN
jgi:hypothetical protein